MKRSVRYAAVLGAAVSLSAASAALAHHSVPFAGEPGDAAMYDRVITITPATKYITVSHGETVKIMDAASGKNIVWRFDPPSFALIHMQALEPYVAMTNQPLDAYVTAGDNGGD